MNSVRVTCAFYSLLTFFMAISSESENCFIVLSVFFHLLSLYLSSNSTLLSFQFKKHIFLGIDFFFQFNYFLSEAFLIAFCLLYD